MSIGIRAAIGLNRVAGRVHYRQLKLAAFVSPVLLVLLWGWVSHLQLISPQLLASPLEVASTFQELLASGELQEHLSKSLSRLAFGYSLGASAGLLFGILMALSKNVEALCAPLFHGIRQIPTIALIPIFILLLGVDESFKIAIVIKASFFTVALAAYEATRGVSVNYLEVARVYKLPWTTLYGKVIIPAIFPPVLTGLRIAFARSWTVLVAAELLVADSGLGQMMQMGRDMFRLDIVLVGVVLTGVIGFCIDRSFKWGEAHLVRWRVA